VDGLRRGEPSGDQIEQGRKGSFALPRAEGTDVKAGRLTLQAARSTTFSALVPLANLAVHSVLVSKHVNGRPLDYPAFLRQGVSGIGLHLGNI
jgi:hypothetical protein